MTPPRGPALLLLALVTAAAAFNLEVRVPVVKVGGEYGDSFFGYSVAGHRAVAGPGGEAVVLVGAPQDRNLQPGTATSGALYRSVSCEYFYTADKYFFEILTKLSNTLLLCSCPLSSATSDCAQVVTDGKRHNSAAGSRRSYHGIYDGAIRDDELRAPISSEIKDGQWLGVAVSSQGETHRYLENLRKNNFKCGKIFPTTFKSTAVTWT